MRKVAMCSCGEPLVMTFVYPGKEFVCVVCRRTYTFFGPIAAAAETPELLSRSETRKSEWHALTNGLLPRTAYLRDCERCHPDYHYEHATSEELAADESARARMEKGAPA